MLSNDSIVGSQPDLLQSQSGPQQANGGQLDEQVGRTSESFVQLSFMQQQSQTQQPQPSATVMVSQRPDGQMQGQQPARRPITLAELQLKASDFKNAIAAGESRIKSLRDQAMNNHLPQESIAQEISKVQKELMERRQALQKIMQILRANSTNGAAAGAFSNGMDM